MSIITVTPGSARKINSAVVAAKANDVIELETGDYDFADLPVIGQDPSDESKRTIYLKNNIKIRSKVPFGARLIGNNKQPLFTAGQKRNVTLEDMVFSKCGCGVTMTKCVDTNVSSNIFLDSVGNAISIQQGDYHTIEGNILAGCVKGAPGQGGRSAISVLLIVASNEPNRADRPFRIQVRNNVGWSNVPTEGAKTDGNFIIIDGGSNGAFSKYQYPVLVEGNIGCGNGGSGIRYNWMASGRAKNNLVWDNHKDLRGIDTTATNKFDGYWLRELSNQWSKNVEWIGNIAIAKKAWTTAYGNDIPPGKLGSIPDASAIKVTTIGNKLYNTAGGKAVNGAPKSAVLPSPTGGTAPTVPAIPALPTTAAQAVASANILRSAYNALFDGTDPVPSFSVTAPPSLTSPEHRAGKTLTFTSGGYSVEGTPVTVKAQILDTGNVYRALPGAVSIDIGKYPDPADATANGITAKLDASGNASFRIIERYTRPDGTEGVNASDPVALLPKAVDPETIETVRAERDAARAERDAARAERDAALSDLDDARTEIDTLNEQSDLLGQALADVTDERNVALSERDSARTERDNLSTSLIQAQADLSQAQADLAVAQSSLTSVTAERDNALAELADVQANRTAAEAAVAAMKTALDGLSA